MSDVKSWVELKDLGPVRYHKYMEEFAEAVVGLGAINEENAVPATVIASKMGIDKKTVYNRLGRPGFVKVDNGPGANSTFYYLFDDRFGPLARSQGHAFYPENLGPLAVDKIPKVVERDLLKRTKTVDIRGNSTHSDDLPVMVRTLELSNSEFRGITDNSHRYDVSELLSDPIKNQQAIENMMVLLGGVWRWVDRYNSADVEKQIWMKSEIRYDE